MYKVTDVVHWHFVSTFLNFFFRFHGDFFGFDFVLRIMFLICSNLLYGFWVKPLQKSKENASSHSSFFTPPAHGNVLWLKEIEP